MTTLTLTIDEGTLSKAEAQAKQRGTTVEDLLRRYLDGLAKREAVTDEAVRSLLSLAKKAQSGSGGRRWSREEAHER